MRTIAALLFIATSAYSQSVETSSLRWSVSSFKNLTNKESVNHPCIFESSPTMIRWIQKNGALTYEFTVTGKSGSWADVTSNGALTYLVTFRGQSGTVRFERSGSSINIEPNIQIKGANILHYVFSVSAVTKQ